MKTRRVVKTKKALKRLDRVEALLLKVIEQYAKDESGVRELLDSAKASLVRAKVKMKAPAKGKPPTRTKSAAKAKSRATAKSSRSAALPKKSQLRTETTKKSL